MKMNAKNIVTKTAIAAAAAALLLPTVAAAEGTPHELCTAVSGFAEVVMDRRQGGAPMSVMMEAAADITGIPAIDNAVEVMVVDAYSRPLYNTDQYKLSAIREFTNDAYRYCITGFR